MSIVMGMEGAVGSTPLVELRHVMAAPDGPRILAKLERFNPGGSAKDRPAAAMIAAAMADGALRRGGTIIESSSGNLGVSLAQQAVWNGLDFICVVDPRINPSTRRLIEAYGARVVCLDLPDPETGDWLIARIEMVKRLVAATPGAYWPNQYANPANAAAHASGTMREIVESVGERLTAVYVATSSTGTVNGCLDYIRTHRLNVGVVAVDAVGSRLFGGTRGHRALPGFGAGMEPPLAVGTRPDAVIRVSDLDAVRGCRHLVATEGLLAGASGGAVVVALARDALRYGPQDTVAMILHDGGEAYLGTVYDDQWVASHLGGDADDLRLAPALVAVAAR